MTTSDRTHLAAPPLPPGRSSLVVTGFMGTGKTEAGRRAARLLGRPFVDLDAVIERRTGRSIAEVFQQEGEDAFRSLERTAVADAARLSGAVIATGGGAPLDRTSFAPLAEDAVVAVLTCEEPELLRRLRHDRDRPLLTHDPPGRITLLAERADAFAAAGGSLDTTALDPEQAATALVERFRSTTSAATEVRIAAGSSTVVVGPGTVAELGFELRRAVPEATAAAVVMDEAVEDTAGASVEEALRRAGMPVLARAVVPAGEGAKRVETTAGLWNTFLACGLDPTGVVVAVGGGTLTDVAGFAAATYLRGVALANVPTTLLAMVDASLGGKTGIDHGGRKNVVGAFHDPVLTVADTTLLGPLPIRLIREGLAEVVKAAVIASPLLFELLEGDARRVLADPALLAWVVEQAVRIKAAYVSADPRDRHLRHSLNLGHTFAHAIEAATAYATAHGEAVAIGLVAAARLGAAVGVTDPGMAARLEALLVRLGLPVTVPDGVDPAALLEAMTADKKRRSGRAMFVIPAPGGVDLVEDPSPDEVLRALRPEAAT